MKFICEIDSGTGRGFPVHHIVCASAEELAAHIQLCHLTFGNERRTNQSHDKRARQGDPVRPYRKGDRK